MAWEVRIAHRADRELARLSVGDREAIYRALRRLADDPGKVDLAKVSGTEDEWRLRVGRYRVRLRLDNAAGIISVLRVLPRGSAYRG